MASGEASAGCDAWDELAAGATGEDAPVRVRTAFWLHLPNRRIRDPNVRWCGRGEAVRLLPIPISRKGGQAAASFLTRSDRRLASAFARS
jgi:hypothetical protein